MEAVRVGTLGAARITPVALLEPVLTPPEDSIADRRVVDAVCRAAGLEPRAPTRR